MKRIFLFLSLILIAFVAPGQASFPRQSSYIRVVELSGTPFERGFTHGKTLKKEINELVAKWKAELSKTYKMDADIFIGKFLKETDFLPAINKWTPGLLEEVKGIAEGSGVDFDTMLMFQLVDEEWVNGSLVAAEHCSSIGLDRQGKSPAIVAQNLDLSGYLDGYQVVLHIRCKDSSLETFVLTYPGLIAACGMNNSPLGVCVNTLSQLSHCSDGLPVAFVVRALLEQRSLEEAAALVKKVKHASGQNYIIGGNDRTLCFECSSGKATEYRPRKDSKVVYHTNHPVLNDDLNAEFIAQKTAAAIAGEDLFKMGSSYPRFISLEKRIGGKLGGPGLAGVKAALRSRDSDKYPVCRTLKGGDDTFTFGSVIMVLSGKPRMLVTAGPPNQTEYTALAFSR
jgi:isopenicillin-N N-acyltransferase like protein